MTKNGVVERPTVTTEMMGFDEDEDVMMGGIYSNEEIVE